MNEGIQLITCWPPPDSDEGDEDVDRRLDCKLESERKRSLITEGEVVLDSKHVKRIKNDEEEKQKTTNITATVAQWWKRNQALRKKYENSLPQSSNPNTILNSIFRLPETQEFMKLKLDELHSSGKCEDSLSLALIGSFYEKLGDLYKARDYLTKAIEIQCDAQSNLIKEWKWLLHKIRKKIEIAGLQKSATDELNKRSPVTELKLPTSLPVERRSVEDLSVNEFIAEYSMKSKPVIITGLASKMSDKPFNIERLQKLAGDCPVTLKKLVTDSAEWAQLEDAESMKLSAFIDYISNGNIDRYLFDWSLPIHCPDLVKDLKIPRYFSGDFLQRTSAGSLYKDSWPSLFVAPVGIRSELHVDAFGSNFWMALFQGKKRWVFFSKDDLPYLYPDYTHSMDPVFSVDLSEPDFDKYPLLRLTKPMECILQEGDVLFVPAGCPHRVENLEKSIAISANFVDKSNFDSVKKELAINALIDSRAAELLNQFENPKFSDESISNTSDNCTCTSWFDFKNPELNKS
ncbi:bifunctional arginine demethylase and lysyl-hydroxylase JMJD6-like [Tubulanus polymorphus]|uniref:bifunctional arginine demethylase and lysyl-hydroxylase JMJD6-like n=1 Tax=Tubulanus polymorphus TaxID=672921 RepID=UPI003DA66340